MVRRVDVDVKYGRGVITYDTTEDAQHAVRYFHGTMVKGQKLRLQMEDENFRSECAKCKRPGLEESDFSKTQWRKVAIR